MRGVGQGRRPRVWQADPVQAPLEQVRAPPSHSVPSGRGSPGGQMAEDPEQVEAAEHPVPALHSTSTWAKVQSEVQQTPSDGEQDADLVLVQGVLPSGWEVFGTQQSSSQRLRSYPQSHSSQPSTTELPHTPCNGFTLQHPRLLLKGDAAFLSDHVCK